MGHYVTTADSDYFEGWCECDQRPCLSCVAAQRGLEAADKLRGDLVKAYREHHGEWPRATFTDAVIEVFRKHGLELKLAPTKNLVERLDVCDRCGQSTVLARTAGQPLWCQGCKPRLSAEEVAALGVAPCAKYGCGPFCDGRCVACGDV